MNGYYSKRLQKTSTIYQELQELIRFYVACSVTKEQKQKNYLKNLKIVNVSTGETLEMDYDLEKKCKEYAQIVEQRSLTIQELARRDESMVSFFGTLTLPSFHHPFVSIETPKGRLYVKDNPEFAFESLEEAISSGYQLLKKIYETFYKRVKNHTKEELLYVKVIEHHATMIPHMHFVMYFPIEHLEKIKIAFQKVVEEFGLNRVDFERASFRDNLNYASRYLLKYITKDLNNSSDIFKARVLDGWKRYHKIRTLTTSQLPLNVMVYKKIYTSVSFFEKNRINSLKGDNIKTLKEQIDEEVERLNIPIYLYFQDNTYIEKTIIDGKKKRVVRTGNKDALIHVKLTTEKKVKSYCLKHFEVSYKNEKIYTKQKFIKMRI